MDELTVIGEVVEEGIWMEKEDERRKIGDFLTSHNLAAMCLSEF